MKRRVYLDNAATTPVDPRVIEAMLPYLGEKFGNPSSVHAFGREARVAVEEARETVAESINADPSEIYFAGSGTEANNFPIFGIARTEAAESGRTKILTDKAEHSCVLDAFARLGELGFEARLMEVDQHSLLSIARLEENIAGGTSLVSIIHINNETGAINDIEALSTAAKREGAYFHTDAVQSFGKTKIDVDQLGIDALSLSGHKIGGPKGIGAVYVRQGTPLSPMIFGGSQERNRRGGTENVPGIVGLAEAVRIRNGIMASEFEHVSRLNERFVRNLNSLNTDGLIVNGGEKKSPYILSLTFSPDHFNTDAEAMLIYLDINGIAASSGAACTSGTLKPSHVIMSMNRSKEEALGTIRFSLGGINSGEDIDYASEIIGRMCLKFRK